MGIELYEPPVTYKLIYWSSRVTSPYKPYGEQVYDLTDHAPGDPMDGTELSEVYQRLSDDPTIYKIEIWQLFAGLERKKRWKKPFFLARHGKSQIAKT